jgi:hypothetical protein
MLTLVPISNSTGVVIPREELAHLQIERGEGLYLHRTPDGIELRVTDPEFTGSANSVCSRALWRVRRI